VFHNYNLVDWFIWFLCCGTVFELFLLTLVGIRLAQSSCAAWDLYVYLTGIG